MWRLDVELDVGAVAAVLHLRRPAVAPDLIAVKTGR